MKIRSGEEIAVQNSKASMNEYIDPDLNASIRNTSVQRKLLDEVVYFELKDNLGGSLQKTSRQASGQ